MLPSKTELIFAKKGKFDLYTITNLSFMDIAYQMGVEPNLYAVSKKDLRDREEVVPQFLKFETFFSGNPSVIPLEISEKKEESCDFELKFDAEFDLKV